MYVINRKLAEKHSIIVGHVRRFYGIHYLMQVGYLLTLISLILHVLDRQVEYTSRTDILWKSKLRVEQDEVETMRGINKILLENILPAHVADHFLATRATQVSFRPLSFILFAINITFHHGSFVELVENLIQLIYTSYNYRICSYTSYIIIGYTIIYCTIIGIYFPINIRYMINPIKHYYDVHCNRILNMLIHMSNIKNINTLIIFHFLNI